jgi:hypothetical protein
MANSSDWFYFTNPAWKQQTGNEPSEMHQFCGQKDHSDCINIYYFEKYEGDSSGAFTMVPCEPDGHNTYNVFICTYGPAGGFQITLPHECGHAISRYYDEYLVDVNHNLIITSGETCNNSLISDWCYLNGYPLDNWYLFCTDSGTYPQNPGADGKTPKNLMWYSWPTAVSQYDVVDSQYCWVDAWLYSHIDNYPFP